MSDTEAGSGKGAGAGGKEEEEEMINIGGRKYHKLADGAYDAIILGTGLKECMLSGMLAVFKGMKVLQLDRNDYYGSDTASLNLTNLYRRFVDKSVEDAPEDFCKALGKNRDYNVDLIPKFIMADGQLVKMLVKAGVADYLEFKVVDGCFVYKKGSGIHKMPATAMEAAKTSLMGFFQKRKFKSFLNWVFNYEQEDAKTHNGYDCMKLTMAEVYGKFGLDGNSQDFIGHAMALHTEDSYLKKAALPTIKRIKLYGYSMQRYGSSPFIYPKWGIGGMPEGFSRKSAIHHGTFMLNKDIDEILFDNDGHAIGVRSGDAAATARVIIGEPTYFPKEKVASTGKVVRSICILDHMVAGIKSAAAGAASGQVIVPANQVGRTNDIYISVLSHSHQVVAAGKVLAIASTTAETAKPLAEIDPAIALLGGAVKRFDTVADTWSPKADGRADGCFITESYDATSHFESTMNDVASVYERVTGETLASAGTGDEKK